MRVDELIEKLSVYPDDHEVYVSEKLLLEVGYVWEVEGKPTFHVEEKVNVNNLD